MTTLAPIRLVRSRTVQLEDEGPVRVVVDKVPEVSLYQVAVEQVDSGHLLFPELYDSLVEATATLGKRFQSIINRAHNERNAA